MCHTLFDVETLSDPSLVPTSTGYAARLFDGEAEERRVLQLEAGIRGRIRRVLQLGGGEAEERRLFQLEKGVRSRLRRVLQLFD